MSKHYILTLNTFDRPVPYEKLQEELNKFKDWARYAPKNWIIWTSLDSEEIYKRIRSTLDPKDQLLVIKADPGDHRGWLANESVEWFKRKRQTTGE